MSKYKIPYATPPHDLDGLWVMVKRKDRIAAEHRVDELKAENDRLKLKLFYPVDESADPFSGGLRKNFQRINANFEICVPDLSVVNVGAEPDDATGDPMRVAWVKVNENFAKIEKHTVTTKGK
jgi:hypothetical protein